MKYGQDEEDMDRCQTTKRVQQGELKLQTSATSLINHVKKARPQTAAKSVYEINS